MSLENVEPIKYIDVSPEKTFLPSLGIDRAEARALARDFANQQEVIFAEADNISGEDGVKTSSDDNWIFGDMSNFKILGRDSGNYYITFSKIGFEDRIAYNLGVNTAYAVNASRVKYFFDKAGNFGKVRNLEYAEPDCISVGATKVGNPFHYRREQMQAGDFEYVGFILFKMREGLKSIQEAAEQP